MKLPATSNLSFCPSITAPQRPCPLPTGSLEISRLPLAAFIALLIAGFVLAYTPTAYAQAPCTLLLLGDSITAGYGLQNRKRAMPAVLEKYLQKAGHSVIVINGGVSGDTSRDLMDRLDWAMVNKPQAVIVAIGGNDILRAFEPKELEKNLHQTLKQLTDEYAVAIGLVGIAAPPSAGQPYRQSLREAYRNAAQQHNAVLEPDIYATIRGNHRMFQSDGIHPNVDGAESIAQHLLPLATQVVNKGCR